MLDELFWLRTKKVFLLSWCLEQCLNKCVEWAQCHWSISKGLQNLKEDHSIADKRWILKLAGKAGDKLLFLWQLAKVFPTYLQIISRISAINCKIFSKYLQNICKILSKISSKYLQDISKTKTYKDMWIFETLNTTNDYSEIFIACQVKRMQNGYEKREIWMGC